MNDLLCSRLDLYFFRGLWLNTTTRQPPAGIISEQLYGMCQDLKLESVPMFLNLQPNQPCAKTMPRRSVSYA